jgi:O-antigen/teichoic acid export membrane protein
VIVKLKTFRYFSSIIHWSKLITITGGAQMLVQGLGLISGILLIRLMPVKEYAWYTIANTMLGTLTILSDGGISTGVMAEGGKVWQDKTKLGSVLATGMSLRRNFALGSLIISIPILLYLLIHQQASWVTAIMIALSIIPAFYAALSDNLLEIPLKLHQDIITLQKNQIYTAIGRLILMIGFVFLMPFAVLALVGNGLPRIWANIQLRKKNKKFVDFEQESDPIISKTILKLVKRLLPGAIYYSFSGQVTIWLLSIFGTSSNVAEIGALGRISMIFSLFTVLFSTLLVPRFAKIQETKNRIKASFIYLQVFALLFFSVLFLCCYFLENYLLLILGGKYLNLKAEMLLSILASFTALLAGLTYSLYTSRGWAMQPYVYIPVNLIAIVFGGLYFNMASISGVLYLSIFTATIQYIMNFIFSLYCFQKYIS